MQLDFAILRISMYGLLAFFSFLVLCLSGARLQYTTHLPKNDPLDNGRTFYDPIVAEILATMIMTIFWCIFIMYSIHKRYENPYLSTFLGEVIGLSILWLLWIVGAAIASTIWGNLGWCQQFGACRILSALVAFSWLGWLVLSLLLGFSLLFSFANKGFMDPLHGRWNPRESRYTVRV